MTDDPMPADAVLEEAPRHGTGELLLVSLLALGAEAGAAALAFGMLPVPSGAYGAIAVHLVTLIALAWWVRSRARRELDLRLAGLLLVTTPFLGPLGPGCTLMTTALHAIFHRYATGFQEWYLSLFPESQAEPAQELYELIVSGRETAHLAAGESFTDVMSVGTPPQKQAVIALVARHFRPAFTPALKAGLADADPSVRVQAATATARVEHEFNERWLMLDHAAQSNPQDVATRYALARHLDDYAFCGLLDSNREQEIRDKALNGYRRCLELAPDDDEIRHDLGRLLLRCGLVEEAASTLEPLIDRAGDRRILFWYAESLFRLHRYADLRNLSHRRPDLLGDASELPDALKSVVALWHEMAEEPEAVAA
ncbi:tetratricopeptide repeat protein [Azospirillum soli]|uniref:tetratricopeptide repeat protein n=1 Tax=Azospirillum soli TaxID=1304799 RepID=UPI001AE1B121|nr:tetratricopeptide repeat protein [Azospirillum soli]MBP2315775.1 tetratricopeptide (TPR) repeat protein [Azospirillum soli]